MSSRKKSIRIVMTPSRSLRPICVFSRSTWRFFLPPIQVFTRPEAVKRQTLCPREQDSILFKGFRPFLQEHPMGDRRIQALRVQFEGKIKLKFHGAKLACLHFVNWMKRSI